MIAYEMQTNQMVFVINGKSNTTKYIHCSNQMMHQGHSYWFK